MVELKDELQADPSIRIWKREREELILQLKDFQSRLSDIQDEYVGNVNQLILFTGYWSQTSPAENDRADEIESLDWASKSLMERISDIDENIAKRIAHLEEVYKEEAVLRWLT